MGLEEILTSPIAISVYIIVILAGAVILVAYSAGKVPVSYLPVGELVSGFTLSGLVPLGVYSDMTGRADPVVLWKCIPMMLLVSHFMLVNNTCDIERDIGLFVVFGICSVVPVKGYIESSERYIGLFQLRQLIRYPFADGYAT